MNLYISYVFFDFSRHFAFTSAIALLPPPQRYLWFLHYKYGDRTHLFIKLNEMNETSLLLIDSNLVDQYRPVTSTQFVFLSLAHIPRIDSLV